MKTVTFHVLEGIDKGRVFRNLPIPVTIGREEGNILRLNDERISRYHAKVQQDNEDVILTDLDSTNGTRVNGAPVQIRRLRPGDQICLGRSMLLFGTHEEIAARRAASRSSAASLKPTLVPHAPTVAGNAADEFHFEVSEGLAAAARDWLPDLRDLPPLPQKLSPAQAARFAEILDFLHRGLTSAVENVQALNEEATVMRLPFAEWQKIQAVQLFLANYLRAIAEPDSSDE
jgi:hypothetical protein